MAESDVRTLTVACTAGLCNRLRVLLSGMVLAEASGRQFTMVWPHSVDCAATFTELFTGPWPVQSITAVEWANLRHAASRERVRNDPLTQDTHHLNFWTSQSLLMPKRFPAHRPLRGRMGELLTVMQPTDDILTRVDEFQTGSFRSQMIGVHLRRGDLRLFEPVHTDNLRAAMHSVDAYLAQCPDAGVLLCTDDGAPNQYSGTSLPTEGLRASFMQRYGKRVVFTTPRSLNRREPTAIQDALVDLWLLRKTHYFVGTVGSSFSDTAVMGRSVPVSWCQSQHSLRHLVPLRSWLRRERPLKWLAHYYWRIIRPRGES